MRKKQKHQILKLVETIYTAHEEIKKQLESHNYERAIEMLAECQEAAAHIGKAIEDSEGEGLEVITYLEDYCDTLYEISLSTEAINVYKVLNNLNRQLMRIESNINNKIEFSYEIVFLPYKASMWDSLESIWLATKEDKNSKCYVIPIPYYDRNADGSFGAMHYEADLLPEYVPVTSYNEYDFVSQRPDIIYFHNPYDQYNYVTSVHPAFYSSELKKHTDMLVYVPYFVSIDNVPEHLCEVNGIFYADRVIVQSESEKEIYSRVFIKVAGENQRKLEQLTGEHNSRYWEELKNVADEKFLPLGSPKLDKVRNTKREDVILPEEWKKAIFMDGKRKKVVLYNTTLDALLRNGKKMMEKINATLLTFSLNKDVVLLWRPHPLSEATIASMLPELLIEYRNIVNIFKDAGWGIYDDTADLNRAIAISDAYYGDWSSLVALYKVTGKPIMIQNVEVLS